MIEITCVYKGSPMSLDVKYKTGKKILDFRYGTVLTSEVVNEEDLKRSIETGILKQYILKGWVLPKRVNVYGAIQGAPVEFKGITADEAVRELEKQAEAEKNIEIKEDKTIEPKIESSNKIVEEPTDEDEKIVEELENQDEQLVEEIKSEVEEKPVVEKPKGKRGRKPKAVKATNIEEIAIEPKVNVDKEEDDFL